MFKFNNSTVPNKVRIGCNFSSNKYIYRDAYSALYPLQRASSFLQLLCVVFVKSSDKLLN